MKREEDLADIFDYPAQVVLTGGLLWLFSLAVTVPILLLWPSPVTMYSLLFLSIFTCFYAAYRYERWKRAGTIHK